MCFWSTDGCGRGFWWGWGVNFVFIPSFWLFIFVRWISMPFCVVLVILFMFMWVWLIFIGLVCYQIDVLVVFWIFFIKCHFQIFCMILFKVVGLIIFLMISLVVLSAIWLAVLIKGVSGPVERRRGWSFCLNVVVDEHLCYLTLTILHHTPNQ